MGHCNGGESRSGQEYPMGHGEQSGSVVPMKQSHASSMEVAADMSVFGVEVAAGQEYWTWVVGDSSTGGT